MPIYRDDAVILRTQLLGEADRIVTLFSREHGIIRAVAKGVRKTASKFGARLEPFMVADLMLYEGRSLDVITQADLIYSYGAPIAADYSKFTAANVMAEVVEKLAEDEAARPQYHLLIGALRTLADGSQETQLVLNSYLLRAMSIAGWAPNFDDCVLTGEPGPHQFFSIILGGVVSSPMAPGAVRLSIETTTHLAALIMGDWAEAAEASQHVRNQASGVIAGYVQHHLDRKIKSLVHLDRMMEANGRG
ncbi:MAG: DNA repair protein RecO [Microbacteriaceae bacterium]